LAAMETGVNSSTSMVEPNSAKIPGPAG